MFGSSTTRQIRGLYLFLGLVILTSFPKKCDCKPAIQTLIESVICNSQIANLKSKMVLYADLL